MISLEDCNAFKPGDIITFSGQYKKRTFWQWLTHRQKQLEKFRVINTDYGAEATIEAI